VPHGKKTLRLATLSGSVAALILILALVLRAQTPPTSTAQVARNQALNQRFTTQILPLLNQYCYNCHGNGKHKGDLSLERFTSLQTIQAERKIWTNLADLLEQRSMPPDNKPQPTEEQYKLLLAWIDEAVNQIDCSGPRDPGYIAIHRLNRNEYNNTIRDLVGVDFKPAADFPADDTGYGFDNIADVLTMSPLLAEKYLAAADEILDRAVNSAKPLKSEIVKYTGQQFKGETGEPFDGSSAWMIGTNGQISRRHEFPADGDYEIRIRAWQEAFGDEPAKMTVRFDNKDIKTFDVPALREKPGVYTLRQAFTAGSHKIATAYINNLVDNKNPDPKKRGDRNLIIDRIEIEGPANPKPPTPSENHKKLFFIAPGNGVTPDNAARQIINQFAGRAFRRPARVDEIDRLMKLYFAAKTDGESFVQCVRVPLTAVLVSPQFMYRIELDPKAVPGTVHPITDYELASRLSYFLWTSTPDEELLTLAQQNRLHVPVTLDAQVKRMLADPKSKEFVRNFAGQWLELRNLDSHMADAQRFPEFDDKLRESMKRETEMFFENVIKEDKSLLDLLNGDYTFVNERLAKLYGIKDIKGDDFQKVSLAGTHRGGVMTMASVLTITAMPTRTSPVKRGVYVLENILGTPPPPPPPAVPSLSDKPKDEASAPLRQRLAQHRSDPNCSVCHMRMDGIGFSLENFGPLGAWRDYEGKFPVDATGELVGGRKINGPEGLRDLLASRKADFVRCLTEKMLTYALGRGMQDYDRCTIKDITQALEKNNYKFSTLISGIVKSDTFLKRRSKRADEN
jgi:mono/diheme cytochrome c family protein